MSVKFLYFFLLETDRQALLLKYLCYLKKKDFVDQYQKSLFKKGFDFSFCEVYC